MEFSYEELARSAYISYLQSDVFLEFQVFPAPSWEQLPPQIQDLWLNSVKSLGALVNPAPGAEPSAITEVE
jgi:hypothetical protein